MIVIIRRTVVASGLAIVVASSGCASTSGGSKSWFSGWFSSEPKSSTAQYLEGMGGKQPSAWEKFTAGVKGTFSKAGGAVAANEPKAPSANDPTSLANPAKPSAEFYVQAGRMQETAGNSAGAVEQYNKALELTPDHLGALLGLALLHDRQGDFDSAAEFYLRAATKHPNQAAVLNNLGLCQARQGKLAEAAKSMQKAVAMQPNKALYRNNLANVLIEAGQIDEAIALLTPVHGAATAHYNVGYLLHKRDRDDEAIVHFQQAVDTDPSLIAAKGWLQQLEGKAEQVAIAAKSDAPVAPATPVTEAVESAAPTAVATTVNPSVAPANEPPVTPTRQPQTTASIVSDAPTSQPVARSTPATSGTSSIAMVSDQPGGKSVPARTKIAFSRPTEAAQPAPVVAAVTAPPIKTGPATIALDQPTSIATPEQAPPDLVDQPENEIPNTAQRAPLEGSRYQ
ncbi:MAG: tetratricopeptide repeat protein [Planctomycetaceae bacterium]|nr:tetratricopeptide repeat protein [Planctomycetaceae bacterium]